MTDEPDPLPTEARPDAEAAAVIVPRASTRRLRLSAEEKRLLQAYHDRQAAQEREAPAPAAPTSFEARSRFSHEAVPINEKRQPAKDGPPPATFDPEGPATPEGAYASVTGFAAVQAGNRKRRPPTGLNLAPRKPTRTAC